jgi:hypothetical protein
MTPRALVLVLVLAGCGARTSLSGDERAAGGGGASSVDTSSVAAVGGSDATGGGGSGGEDAPRPCDGIAEEPCGSDVGECSPGIRRCQPDGFFGPCEGDVPPRDELCNDLDDDCDGAFDEDFGIGQACDGADADACADDVMTCSGCTLGTDLLETCNGMDDDCDGIIDADCDSGGCSPTLLVTGSTPSSPGCVDFPVEPGSSGTIEYPCEGGPVTATLGTIAFTGSVSNGEVFLSGTAQVIGPDQCLWQNDHFITGSIPAGVLSYFYEETLLTQGQDCWSPCTETGTVEITWR